jgi:L-amino acid N-acyltransferase YncA
MIDDMQRDDWETVRAIYREGLATGLAAFMLNPPSWKAWDSGHLTIGRLVARTGDDGGDGTIAGWAALAPVPDT